jgi:response regulator RpfG family c-di-GMP phosphodiesterase
MEAIKIVLVDDEELVLAALRRTLRRDNYEVIAFTAPEQALQFLETNPADIIISDHRMPTMSGLDFLIKVRKLHPETVRILLTGYADVEVAIRAINEGKLFRFLTKPWKDEELKATLLSASQLRRLTRRNRELADAIKRQDDYIQSLEAAHPGIGSVRRDATGAILLEEP